MCDLGGSSSESKVDSDSLASSLHCDASYDLAKDHVLLADHPIHPT